MKNLKEHVNAFLADEQGAETVEWVMIAAILAVIISAAYWTALGDALNTAIDRIATCMSATSAAGCV